MAVPDIPIDIHVHIAGENEQASGCRFNRERQSVPGFRLLRHFLGLPRECFIRASRLLRLKPELRAQILPEPVESASDTICLTLPPRRNVEKAYTDQAQNFAALQELRKGEPGVNPGSTRGGAYAPTSSADHNLTLSQTTPTLAHNVGAPAPSQANPEATPKPRVSPLAIPATASEYTRAYAAISRRNMRLSAFSH